MSDVIDYQALFNLAVPVIGALGGWFAKMMHGEIRQQQAALSALQVKLAEEYVPRAEYSSAINGLHEKLDQIIHLMGQKVDRK